MSSAPAQDYTKAAADLIRELLNKSPINIPPWRVAQFFENESNIREEYLDKSLDTLAEVLPEFELKNKEMVEELRKISLLAVPMFRKLQLMTILAMVRESLNTTDAFPYIPDFPKPPAANILNHIFPPDLETDDKTAEFEKIAKQTPELLKHLGSWRDHVASYTTGLEQFLEEYEHELSEEQKDHIEVLLERSRSSVTQIDGKIETKQRENDDEKEEFQRFFKVLKAEPKYAKMTPAQARGEIRRVYYELDEELRVVIARQAADEPSETVEDASSPRSLRKRSKPSILDTSYSPTTSRRPKPPTRYNS